MVGDGRSFITALRSGPQVAFEDLANDLGALADRLSRQWDVRCEFSAAKAEMMIPTRLHLDALQLMREAVANAVTHAYADSNPGVIELSASASPSFTLYMYRSHRSRKIERWHPRSAGAPRGCLSRPTPPTRFGVPPRLLGRGAPPPRPPPPAPATLAESGASRNPSCAPKVDTASCASADGF